MVRFPLLLGVVHLAALVVLTPPSYSADDGAATIAVKTPIDRHALVSRHNVILTTADVSSPLSVGNGEFAFTADVTGLQTFDDRYGDIPLTTMAQWGFHALPNPHGYSLKSFPLTIKKGSGRAVGYLYDEAGRTPAEWREAASFLYANPSRLHLGRVAMVLRTADGRDARLEDLTDIHQELDLWTGELRSHFVFAGEAVEVSTTCHPDRDLLAVRIRSNLIAQRQLSVLLAFPYGSASFNGGGADWSRPEAHRTAMALRGDRRADFSRMLDDDHYHAALEWSAGSRLTPDGAHQYRLTGDANTQSIEFVAAFSPEPLPERLPTASESQSASSKQWNAFWTSGGAIDLSRSKDPRWKELERRIVLSQYLTRIQCCGSLPPQETGLTGNSWFGKFHLEMHWWHAAHFPLWGRCELLERSLPFYNRILPKAKATAASQGYAGARWPKCVGPAGDAAPTYLECFMIWQQPHPIFYAELLYRDHPGRETLEKYQNLVFESAHFMASFTEWDETRKQYRLGPPFADAAEVYYADHDQQWNPTFETAYWRFGLETAQRWRERLGLPRDKKWDEVLAHLPPLAIREGLYVSAETATDTFTKPGHAKQHPCMLAPLGMLDGNMVDRPTMQRTLHRVLADWDWNETWGWDFPLIAMTAARLGEGETAIDALLMDTGKNKYLLNGHNPQLGPTLPSYLPGNGGLLYAVALMAAGWDGAPAGKHAPGFPDDGSWEVRWEGLQKAP